MKKVNIIGVPEHFNFPWHMAIEEGAFSDRGIDLEWTDIPEGTGKMCQLLQNNETDLAIILTEGIVKSITEGNPSKIVQEYIASPLQWGIHVGAKSKFNSLEDLEHATVAISRYGSGSHLMAYVNAENEDWDSKELKFKVIDNLTGAIDALTEGTADYFMWEHFTTKPIVDQGIFRRVANCPTPWPCFVIAATDTFIKQNKSTLKHILEVINNNTIDFKSIPSINRTLANSYEQQTEDIDAWLSITEWSEKQLSSKTLQKVQKTLHQLDLIKETLSEEKILLL